jgi:hypothetical protein
MTRAGHVHLGKLRIRMSGPAGAYGRRIAERAIEQLSAELPAGLTGEIGRLELKVHVRAGASEAEVEQAIAGAMKNSLQNVRTCGSAEPPRQPTPQAPINAKTTVLPGTVSFFINTARCRPRPHSRKS